MTAPRDTPVHRPSPLCLDARQAWFRQARRIPSPNFDARPPGMAIDLVVIHNISLPPGQFGSGCVARFFCNELDPEEHPFFNEIREMRVSSHLFIERDGGLTQFVDLNCRAWHAGASIHEGRAACNDFSVGIELEGTDEQPYTDPQYRQLVEVLRVLLRTWPALGPHRIVGHSDIAPGRKTDPGPAFDWARLRAGL